VAGGAPAQRTTASGGGVMGHRLVSYSRKFALMEANPPPRPHRIRRLFKRKEYETL
jgi:hypothetical protein